MKSKCKNSLGPRSPRAPPEVHRAPPRPLQRLPALLAWCSPRPARRWAVNDSQMCEQSCCRNMISSRGPLCTRYLLVGPTTKKMSCARRMAEDLETHQETAPSQASNKSKSSLIGNRPACEGRAEKTRGSRRLAVIQSVTSDLSGGTAVSAAQDTC